MALQLFIMMYAIFAIRGFPQEITAILAFGINSGAYVSESIRGGILAVDIGQTIGTVGNTAQCEIAEESHLHFGVKKNSEWVDPQSVMSKP